MKVFFIIPVLVFYLYGCVAAPVRVNTDGIVAEQSRLILSQKNRTDELDKVLKETEKDFRNNIARLGTKLDSLKKELQIVNGKLEEIDHLLKNEQEKQIIQSLDGKISAITDRVINIEKYVGFETPDNKKGVESSVDQLKEVTSENTYALARSLYDKGDFDSSREEFKKILKKWPESENADNAQFWIGETFYRQRWFEKAILEYQKVIDNYPKGNKIPAAILKQGMAFENMGEKSKARLFLKEVIRKFPDSPEAVLAKKNISKLE
ncbi:MAG: tol-pal system protein YbgF [Desulfobacterales bacterium]|jgi:tol-pal system protein YbgF|nr:tol-pal system protein YbgF [Desulfobacteraceae bacterium]MBT4365277.1 tol-pal system protein YbgF [Desulfobacteraceae bacterium]MBT7085051.1 tol-pal system protein YbgF [Desulfobacterales bacterium]MBT7696780.1 tol-pal system protein YbgF [Desulfobacterales bacterium]